jgi:hypothetical protein
MKALTICQPYAHLIMAGEKVVENRTWPTTYRGSLLIHAGKSRGWLERDETGSRIAKVSCGVPISTMAFGAVVGIATLDMCLRKDNILQNAQTDRSKWARDWEFLAKHEHTNGPWCWVLKDIKRFQTPVPFKGAQQIFDVPLSLITEQLSKASCVSSPSCLRGEGSLR